MKKIITYLFIVICTAYVIREVFYFGLTSNKCGVYDKFNMVFNKENHYETVILGSSRAESHFNCRLIDSALSTNSYNLGMEGASLPFALDVFEAYLEKSDFPKTIILNIDYHIRKCDNDTIFSFPRYFPYLKNKTLYQALKKRDERFAGFRYLPLYGLPFMRDNYLAAAIRGFMNKPGQYDMQFYKGFAPVLPANYIKPAQWKFQRYIACDGAVMYSRLNALISRCRGKGAKLILVLSPMYYKAAEQIINKNELLQKIKAAAQLNDIVLLDYSDESLSKDISLFADPFHLNERGSRLFTLKFVSDLQSLNH